MLAHCPLSPACMPLTLELVDVIGVRVVDVKGLRYSMSGIEAVHVRGLDAVGCRGYGDGRIGRARSAVLIEAEVGADDKVEGETAALRSGRSGGSKLTETRLEVLGVAGGGTGRNRC